MIAAENLLLPTINCPYMRRIEMSHKNVMATTVDRGTGCFS